MPPTMPGKMTPQEAYGNVNQVVENYRGTKTEHVILGESLRVIREQLFSKTEAERVDTAPDKGPTPPETETKTKAPSAVPRNGKKNRAAHA